ncbi:MAG: chemotaxis protein CheB [Dokdonella sp.]
MSSTESGVCVALLYETRERGEQLRDILNSFGASVVYEALASALDRDALERSQASVIVVNLDAQNDPDIDNVYELLDDARYRVVFNESEVSNALSGSDHARWVRHLAAKVLGADVDPPRPAGAEAIPAPPAQAVQAAKAERPTSPAIADVAPAVKTMPAPEADKSDDSAFAAGNEALSVAPAAAVDSAAADLMDFDSLIEMPDVAPRAMDDDHAVPDSKPTVLSSAFEIDFDDDAGEFAADASSVGSFADEFGDGPSMNEPGLDLIDVNLTSTPVPQTAAHDLDLDFDLEMDSDTHAAVPVALGIEPASEAAPGTHASTAWSLADVLEGTELPQEVPSGRADFGIEKLRAEEFLAPEGGDETAQEFASAPSDGLSLELIPLEEAVVPRSVEMQDHENWLDPDAVVVPKAKVRKVWVLGASIGGPEAVREFLAGIPRDYPALFLLAQHLGEEFVGMMTNQLIQATKLTVRSPTHGERVAHGDVVVVPNSHRLRVDAEGVVTLERNAAASAFSPSIDRVLQDVADKFGANAGAIIFSGMSSDAAEGCRYLAEQGGEVYAQRPDTCVVSSMIDGVCETGVVSFLGSPQELAEKLLEATA